MQDISLFLTLALFFVLGAIAEEIIRLSFLARVFRDRSNQIHEFLIAIKVFNQWRKEIGGVALKGVGQHFEKWLQRKLEEEKRKKGG